MSLANLVKVSFLANHAFLDTATIVVAFIVLISFKSLNLSVVFGFPLLLKPENSFWEIGLTDVGVWPPVA